MKHAILTLTALLVLLVTGREAANAAIVINGGFETGDMTGWTLAGADLGETESYFVNSGNWAFQGFDNDGVATLSQNLPTSSGSAYNLSFWSATYADVAGNILRYQVGTGPILTVANSLTFAQTTDSFVATGATTTLNFFYETDNGSGVHYLDDISVDLASVPEPATLLVWGGMSLSGLGVVVLRKKYSKA